VASVEVNFQYPPEQCGQEIAEAAAGGPITEKRQQQADQLSHDYGLVAKSLALL